VVPFRVRVHKKFMGRKTKLGWVKFGQRTNLEILNHCVYVDIVTCRIEPKFNLTKVTPEKIQSKFPSKGM